MQSLTTINRRHHESQEQLNRRHREEQAALDSAYRSNVAWWQQHMKSAPAACVVCGEPLDMSEKRNPKQKHCSNRCTVRAHRARAKA